MQLDAISRNRSVSKESNPKLYPGGNGRPKLAKKAIGRPRPATVSLFHRMCFEFQKHPMKQALLSLPQNRGKAQVIYSLLSAGAGSGN